MWQSTPVQTGIQPLAFSDAKLRWVWVTDSHVQALGGSADVALKAAVTDCNTWRPNAFIHTGDIGDNSFDRVQRAFNNLRTCMRPLHYSIGNHDENEVVLGVPNTALLTGRDAFNRSPFYYTDTMTSGDGTLTARLLFLDCNTYDTKASDPTIVNAYHTPGERVGFSAAEPSGGSYRQLTATQRSWIQSVLAGDTTSQIVLVFPHYPIATSIGGAIPTDFAALADILQADGRPTALFCGHVHPDASTYNLISTDTLKTFTVYKAPAMQESSGFVRVTLHLNAGAIVMDSLVMQNYTNPGGWTINAPFS